MPDAAGTPPTQHTVSSEGLILCVWEGPPNGPPVILVHGFPDTHTLWAPVVDWLSDRFRCITYDVRGAGLSDRPGPVEAYRLPHLVTDLVGVLDALAPDERVHLVGHDWGSIQAWEAVLQEHTDPRLTGRIASYTSISGPALAHIGAFGRSSLRGGWQHRREGIVQAMRSWYVYAFQVPVLPELVLRRLYRRAAARGEPLGRWHFEATVPDDAADGVKLYRANLLRRAPSSQAVSTSVPVQLIVPTRDKYVTPAVYREVERFVPDLTRVELDATHWVPRTHPAEVAQLVGDFALAHP
jgi:pimeloyl-ACP methyl ester carboxylesterase